MANCTNPKRNFQKRLQDYREMSEPENDAACPTCGEFAKWVDCKVCEGFGKMVQTYENWSGIETVLCKDCIGFGGHYLCPFGCAQ